MKLSKLYRGTYQFSPEYLRDKLGIKGDIYAIEISSDTADIMVYCRHAQDEMVVPEGAVSPILGKNGGWLV